MCHKSSSRFKTESGNTEKAVVLFFLANFQTHKLTRGDGFKLYQNMEFMPDIVYKTPLMYIVVQI
jgi:hypothetical protein